VFAVVLVFVWTASYAEDVNYGWDVAWRQIGLPLYTAAVLVIWIALNVGLQLGRPIVRGMIRAFLPPRLRGPFSILWTAEGKHPQ
jgi:hypothetical protein